MPLCDILLTTRFYGTIKVRLNGCTNRACEIGFAGIACAAGGAELLPARRVSQREEGGRAVPTEADCGLPTLSPKLAVGGRVSRFSRFYSPLSASLIQSNHPGCKP